VLGVGKLYNIKEYEILATKYLAKNKRHGIKEAEEN
jgi:hypothetical protein